MIFTRKRVSVSSGVEKWLGRAEAERLSSVMKGWYGPRIALAGVPGAVYVDGDGDFSGKLYGSRFSSFVDHAVVTVKNRIARAGRRAKVILPAGFASLSELIAAMSAGGGSRCFMYSKAGTTGVVAATNTLWFVGSQPAAGAAAAAAPGGTVPTDATTGSFLFTNPSGGDTQHFVSGFATASVAANTLLLYDRLFSVTKTMNSNTTEAVTGVPTRYQSQTATDPDYIGGNFLCIECRTALAATAHNWTTCLYTDDAGNTNQTLPSVTGNSGCIINRLDQPVGSWFCPLASGDVGIKDLDQMQCSAAVATGAIDFTIGHPIAFLPSPVANMVCVADGINSAMQLTRIFDDACMAFLEVCKPATTATNYAGRFMTAVS